MVEATARDEVKLTPQGARAVWLGVAVLAAAFGASALLFRTAKGSMTLEIARPSVRPGEILTLRQVYRHEWSTWTMNQNLKVYDASGNQVAVNTETLASRFSLTFPATTNSNAPERAEFGRQLFEIARREAGVMEAEVYDWAVQGGFFIEPIGCPVGLGRSPDAKPPALESREQSFRVFPGTPPGEYRVVVDGSYYCGPGPTGELMFRVE